MKYVGWLVVLIWLTGAVGLIRRSIKSPCGQKLTEFEVARIPLADKFADAGIWLVNVESVVFAGLYKHSTAIQVVGPHCAAAVAGRVVGGRQIMGLELLLIG